jgi:2-methylcitrate dehydratase PrpD
VIYKGGMVVESVVLDPMGSSERPLKRSDIIEKFHLLNQDVLPMPFQKNLIEAIEEIDAKGGLNRLTNLINIKH